jgi:hypothetical protein
VPTEHEPNQPKEPDQADDDERAWEEALLRARGEASGGSDQRQERAPTDEERAWAEALLRARGELTEEDTDVVSWSQPPAIPDESEDTADSAPIELTQVRRKRRGTRPHEPVLPPQQVTVRRRRQTGTMSLASPSGEAGPPADLEPPAPEAAPSPLPAAPAPLDNSARSRERNREREALERVLALAKPRTRQTRATPAVLPHSPRPPSDDSDDGGSQG